MSQLSIFDTLDMAITPAVPGADLTVSRTRPAAVPARKIRGETRQAFISEFRQTAPYLRRSEVFRDFVTLTASELDLVRIHSPESRARCSQITARYKPADIDRMHTLFALLVQALSEAHQDFLGSVYMELELGADEMGQYFTPHHVSSLLAQLAAGELLAQLKSCPYISLQEPTSGAGGMIIAFAEIMLGAGLNPATQLQAITIDIDLLAADMTFVQLSLLGIPAIVNTGNTLTLQMSLARHTPVWFFNDWPERIQSHERVQAMRAFMARLG
jgi:hypothetical protein